MIQRIPFISFMKHTEGNIEKDILLLPSLLKGFSMFNMCLLYHEHNEYVVETIATQSINCRRNNGLNLKDKKGSWYNTTICSKFHGTVFGYLVRNYITDRYNLMCYITTHDRQQPTYV